MIGTLIGDRRNICTDLRGEDQENQCEILQELLSECQDVKVDIVREKCLRCAGYMGGWVYGSKDDRIKYSLAGYWQPKSWPELLAGHIVELIA